MLFAHGSRRQHTPYRGGTNAQTALPLPYTETRLVEEMPTTAQVKHTYVISSRWVNQLSVGFSRLVGADRQRHDRRPLSDRGRVCAACRLARPIRRFPKSRLPVRTRRRSGAAPMRARSPSILNNYTLQNNLQWTRRQACVHVRLPGAADGGANERERTYGSLATFGFSNVQTAGFGPTGTLLHDDRQRLRELPAGRSERDDRHRGLARWRRPARFHDLCVLGAGRLQGDAESVAQPRTALRHHEAVHRDRTIAGRS